MIHQKSRLSLLTINFRSGIILLLDSKNNSRLPKNWRNHRMLYMYVLYIYVCMYVHIYIYIYIYIYLCMTYVFRNRYFWRKTKNKVFSLLQYSWLPWLLKLCSLKAVSLVILASLTYTARYLVWSHWKNAGIFAVVAVLVHWDTKILGSFSSKFSVERINFTLSC